MPLNIIQNPLLPLPSAATSVSISNAASVWGNGSYVQVVASIDACVLSGLVIRIVTDSAGGGAFEIDVATGAAASETVIATFYGIMFGSGNVNAEPDPCILLPIGIDNIGNNSRIAVRMRASVATVFTLRVSPLVYDKPINGTYLTTSSLMVALPAASAISVTSGGGAWTNGSYSQIRSASGSALVLLGLISGFNSNGSGTWEMDIATGGAGSEIVITTFAVVTNAIYAGLSWSPLKNPLDNIAANTRVACRLRGSSANGAAGMALLVIPKPL